MIFNVLEHAAIEDSTRAMPPTTPPTTHGGHRNHLQQFRAYLRRNLLYVQRLVQAADQLLPEEVRTQALHTLSYAMEERDLWPLGRALLLALAPKMELAGRREDWLPYLQQGVAQSKAMEDPAAAAECHLQMGLIYRLLSDFVAAREHLMTSVALAKQAGEQRNQARALNELAWLEQLQEEYAAAEEHVVQAIALLNDDDPERAVCYRVQGMIAFGYKDWQKAEKLHRQALDIFEEQNDLRRMAWSMQNLAYSLREQKKYDMVFYLYQEAIKLLEQLDDKYHWAIVKTNLGIAYYDIGKYDLAVQCYKGAETIVQSMHDKFHFARLSTNYGLVYMAQKDYDQAANAFRQSALIHHELENTSLSINAEDGLVMVLLAQQKYTQAAKIAENALDKLKHLQNSPKYGYLLNSLQAHLRQALEE